MCESTGVGMTLRELFPSDIMQDSNLSAAYLYCLRDAKPNGTTRKLRNNFFDLRPNEVMIELSRIEEESGLPTEKFLTHLDVLQKLKRVSYKERDGVIFLQLLEVSFPINPVDVVQSTRSSVMLDEWIRMDGNNIERFSRKYIELTKFVLKDFRNAIGMDKPMEKLDQRDYDDYVRAVASRVNNQKKENSVTTVNNYTRALKSSMNRAVSQEVLSVSPFKNI